MRYTTKSAAGTSFHGDTFTATVSDLRKILGAPKFENNDGKDKTNFDWTMETEDGKIFTVYDWKYYRPLDENELVEWHIGGNGGITTSAALNEIAGALNELVG
jgi:hypothetical protein